MRIKITYEWPDHNEPIFEIVDSSEPRGYVHKELDVSEVVANKWSTIIEQYYEVQYEIRELVKWDEDK